MLPEIAVFSVITASLLPYLSFAAVNNNLIKRMPMLQSALLVLATSILMLSFLLDNFSVQYIAANSNSALNNIFKLSALWGGHEGSFLLWTLSLSVWGVLVQRYFNTLEQKPYMNLALLINTILISVFILLMLTTANPFSRLFEVPFDGSDLNPLLQDPIMTIHPPILYCGYVGNAVSFSMVVAGLWYYEDSKLYLITLRNVVKSVWAFLTLGIALGSWWAYYELGWGGWWFWDPVENAALIPWLTQVAAIHLLTVAIKQPRYQKIAEFLIIMTFILSILGTFLVRSGLLSSVHAFASDKTRGIWLLVILIILLSSSLYLLIWRALANKEKMRGGITTTRSWLLILNSSLFTIAAIVVLIGTWYPIFDKNVVIGYPYYNMVFIPIMFGIILTMIIAFKPFNNKNFFGINIFISGCLAYLLLFLIFQEIHVLSWLGLSASFALIAATLMTTGKLTMKIAHIGFLVTVMGVSITPLYEIEQDLRLKVGETITVANYQITFNEVVSQSKNNYFTYIANFSVFQGARLVKQLFPEKRIFTTREMATAETAIWPRVLHDLSITISNQFQDDSWAIRVCYKPLIRCIWFGAFIMFFTIFSWRKNGKIKY